MRKSESDKWCCKYCPVITTGGKRGLYEHYWQIHGVARGHILKRERKAQKLKLQ